jgi:hypothetical protein
MSHLATLGTRYSQRDILIPWALGKEEQGNGLYCGRNEEYCQRDSVGLLAHHVVSAVIYGGTNNRTDGQLTLIDSKNDAPQMGWSDFVNIDLRDCQPK